MSFEFEIIDSKKIEGVKIIKPSVAEDSRGTIWTSFLKEDLDSLLPKDLSFNHDKFSESKRNVLRGIHGDDKTWKLVTSVFGEIYQVVVDCRNKSSTFSNWEAFDIKKGQQISVLVPPGVGNAFYVNSTSAVYHYKLAYLESYNDINEQFTIPWDDPRFDIEWPSIKPILSERDSFKSFN